MTLLDAPNYNPRRGIIIRNTIIAVAIALPIIAIVLWWTWLWPEEHRVNHFFQAIEARNYSEAYGIWNHDPDWKQHESKYSAYPFNDFMRDWGPKGEYGVIHSAKVVVSKDWGTGVIVGVLVNEAPKSNTLFLIVNKSTKTIGFSPVELRY